ncbi:MAG: methylated-DNA--[protein]-cysteine S-methyltransferase [Acidobacteriota bacterium]|nr:methylated-DNA--[protein]-cysteine S-methyltransferase [Acidobacteriota bacterium]
MLESMFYSKIESPIGELLLTADARGLTGLLMNAKAKIPDESSHRNDAVFHEAKRQIDAYFAGALKVFDLPIVFTGTPFQNDVWKALCDIPFGETLSYGSLARRVGRPAASRAVGAANGRNPISIIVPCHRVIGADGSLTGYGGGMDRKRWLLHHEGVLTAELSYLMCG